MLPNPMQTPPIGGMAPMNTTPPMNMMPPMPPMGKMPPMEMNLDPMARQNFNNLMSVTTNSNSQLLNYVQNDNYKFVIKICMFNYIQ